MAQVASPYGLRPVQLFGGTSFAGAIRSYSVLANPATAIYYGDPVAIVSGNIQPLTATPTTTVSANSPIGVFLGAEWQDPIRGFVNSQYLPGGLGTSATQVKCKILDHPWAVFRLQANGSIPASQLQFNIALTGIGTGSTATGNSQVAGLAPAAVTATLAMTVIGFFIAPGSAPGDPFTDLLVCWNFGVHRMMNSTAI